jgi:hypothetical protein
VNENNDVIDLYCRCLDGSYGFSCTESFANPCLVEGVQYSSADFRLPNNYFIECNWGIPYLFLCPSPLVWNQEISVCDWDPSSEQGLRNQNIQQQQYGSSSWSPIQLASSSFGSPIQSESQYQSQQNFQTQKFLSSPHQQLQPIQLSRMQQQQLQQPSYQESIVQPIQQVQEVQQQVPSYEQPQISQQKVTFFQSSEPSYQQIAPVQAALMQVAPVKAVRVQVQPMLRVNAPIYETDAPVARIETVGNSAPSFENVQYQQSISSIPEQTFVSRVKSEPTSSIYEAPHSENSRIAQAQPQVMPVSNFQRTFSPYHQISPIQSILQSQTSYAQDSAYSKPSDTYNSVIKSILSSIPKSASHKPTFDQPQPIQSFQAVKANPNLLNTQLGYDGSYGSSQSFLKSSTGKSDQCTCICNNDMNNPIRITNKEALLGIQN